VPEGREKLAVAGLASVEDGGVAVPLRLSSSVQDSVVYGVIMTGVVSVMAGAVVLPARVSVRVMVLSGVIVKVWVVLAIMLEFNEAVTGETRVLGVAEGVSVSTIVSEMTSVTVTSVSVGVAVPVRFP